MTKTVSTGAIIVAVIGVVLIGVSIYFFNTKFAIKLSEQTPAIGGILKVWGVCDTTCGTAVETEARRLGVPTSDQTPRMIIYKPGRTGGITVDGTFDDTFAGAVAMTQSFTIDVSGQWAIVFEVVKKSTSVSLYRESFTFNVAPKPLLTEYTFTVMDQSNIPIRSAVVTVKNADFGISVKSDIRIATDSQGKATFTIIGGMYDIIVEANGYKTYSYTADIPISRSSVAKAGVNVPLEKITTPTPAPSPAPTPPTPPATGCTSKWVFVEWSSCIDEVQEAVYEDTNACAVPSIQAPVDTAQCVVSSEQPSDDTVNDSEVYIPPIKKTVKLTEYICSDGKTIVDLADKGDCPKDYTFLVIIGIVALMILSGLVIVLMRR